MNNITMKLNADDLILNALKEDITSEDISTNYVRRHYQLGEVELICKQDGVIAGLDVFKRVFGKQENERITKALLEEIIESKISNIEIKSDIVTEKNLVDDKVGVLDIKAIIDNEINTNIEKQMVNSSNIIARMLFYWSKMYGQELKSGYDYSRAKKTIVILIADFKLNYLKSQNQKTISSIYTYLDISNDKFLLIILLAILHILEILFPFTKGSMYLILVLKLI